MGFYLADTHQLVLTVGYSIAAYTAIWNLLNYPSCAFPVTAVDPIQDNVQARYSFFSEEDRKNYDLCAFLSLPRCRISEIQDFAHITNVSADHPDTFKNAPVGLQLAGQPYEEEAVLAMTEIVDAALKLHSNGVGGQWKRSSL